MKVRLINLVLVFLFVIFSIHQVHGVEREQPLDISEFGWFAETLAKELTPGISFEEYQSKELRVKNLIKKRKMLEQFELTASNLATTLRFIAQIRERFRQFEIYRAQQFSRPVKAGGPRKRVHADGSVTYSGVNTKIAEYLIKKYAPKYKDVSPNDINDLIQKINNTKGRFAHKRFSITFGSRQEDKLGNVTRIPFSFSLTNEETFFPDWSYYKAFSPKYAQDENGQEFILEDLSYTFTKYDPTQFHGQWYAFNDKESNAFGYSTAYSQKIINKNTGLVTEINQKILKMDFDRREPLKYERDVKEYDLFSMGENYMHTYKEKVDVLNYYETVDSEGNTRYLAKELLLTRLDDNQKPNAVTTSYILYHYDENDRVDKSLIVTNIKVNNSNINYNSISITDNALFDPLTGLSLIENDKIDIERFKGSFEEAKEYGKAIWRTISDEELVQYKNKLGEEKFISQIGKEIASLVVWGNYDYFTAREMVLEKFKGEEKILSLNWKN